MLDYWPYVLVGFLAQIVDGALGMAYGITSSTMLISLGVPVATASATVHAAECFTTGASGLSHHAFGNVDKALFRRLLLPGMAGAVLGAYVLSSLPGEKLLPYVSVYLVLMGTIVIIKAFREFPPRSVSTHLAPLGFFGAFLDAVGGGGWGPVVTSTLIARGNDVRLTVGSVNAVEFFVTFAASMTFIVTLGISNWPIIAALGLGGLLAAPFGALIVARCPRRGFMIGVGALVIVLSLRNLYRSFIG